MDEELVDRIMARCHREGEHLIWEGNPEFRMKYETKPERANRLLWVEVKGALTDDEFIYNACGNSMCIEPEHQIASRGKTQRVIDRSPEDFDWGVLTPETIADIERGVKAFCNGFMHEYYDDILQEVLIIAAGSPERTARALGDGSEHTNHLKTFGYVEARTVARRIAADGERCIDDIIPPMFFEDGSNPEGSPIEMFGRKVA